MCSNLDDNDVSRQTSALQQVDRMNTKVVSITIYGLTGSAEYHAAERLRDLIQHATQATDSGTISIHTDVYFTGQKREQIDILLHGWFPSGLSRRIRLPDWPETEEVSFLDVIAIIEVKAHGRDKVNLAGTNARVLHRDGWKSASSQSNAQVHSVKQFIQQQLGWKPYVCNLIFFPNLVKADFPSNPSNYLVSDSTFEDLVEKLCLSRELPTSSVEFGRVPFQCTARQSAEAMEKRHQQLQEMLGGHQNEVRYRPSQVRRWAPGFRYRRRSFFFDPVGFRRRSHRGLSRIVGFLAGGILCLTVLAAFLNRFVSMASQPARQATVSAAQAPPPTLTACAVTTPSCDCDKKAIFRRGATAYIQFAEIDRTPILGAVRDPQGNASILPFRKLHLAAPYFKGSCFVAKYRISHEAAPGTYALQVTAGDDAHVRKEIVARRFEVTR